MPESFLAILEESARAALPATAEAMENVAARLETVRLQWDAQASHLSVDELAELRQRLREVGLLIDHAARGRMGLARHMQAIESGYTAAGLTPQPVASSWECTG